MPKFLNPITGGDQKQPVDPTLTALSGQATTATGISFLGITILSATDPAPTVPGMFLKMDS